MQIFNWRAAQRLLSAVWLRLFVRLFTARARPKFSLRVHRARRCNHAIVIRARAATKSANQLQTMAASSAPAANDGSPAIIIIIIMLAPLYHSTTSIIQMVCEKNHLLVRVAGARACYTV